MGSCIGLVDGSRPWSKTTIVFESVFAVGAMLAALVGLLVAPITNVFTTMGSFIV